MATLRLNTDEVLDIARKVAQAWFKRGVRGYSTEDMIQDAAMTVLHASSNGTFCVDPSKTAEQQKSQLRGYCFTAAYNEVYHRQTRAMTGPSALGHSQTHALGQTKSYSLQSMMQNSATEARYIGMRIDDQEGAIDHARWCAQVRKRIRRLNKDLNTEALDYALNRIMRQSEDGDAATAGLTEAEARAIRARVQRRLANDRHLYNLAKESPST